MTPPIAEAPSHDVAKLVEEPSFADDYIDQLNVLCEDFGCEPGSNRLHWLHEQLTDANEAARQLSDISEAIGSVRFMDPPDGGDVPLAEQVARMRQAFHSAEARSESLSRDLAEARAALEPFAKVAEKYDGTEHIRHQPALLHYLVDLTIDHFRRARSVLPQKDASDE